MVVQSEKNLGWCANEVVLMLLSVMHNKFTGKNVEKSLIVIL